jgi:iron complex outermembrane receptor protein
MNMIRSGLTFVFVSLLPVFAVNSGFAQTAVADSGVNALAEVQVSAFARTRKLDDHPSAISVISKEDLDRYGNVSLLPALNTAAGVRMEERSPGSYRLSIRGSSLRSPFGVRNVKIYYNDIPLTDPGGFSYFNQLSFGSVQSIQVLKGPSGSLYGQGNGGTMLISSMPEAFRQGVSAGTVLGSYKLGKVFVEARIGDSSSRHMVRYEQLNSDGYREHSALSKKTMTYDGMMQQGERTSFNVHALYTRLEYQTPGALTQKEYEQDPRSARPAAGGIPGSVQQDARIMQENVLLGFSVKNKFRGQWQTSATFYCLYSQMDNPAIRNYSKTIDPHFGGRATISRHSAAGAHTFDWVLGTEIQQGIARTGVYRNDRGTRDTLQTNDEIRSGNMLGFAQLSWQYKKWTLEGGVCIGQYTVSVDRTFPQQAPMDRVGQIQLSPRLAALYHLGNITALYATIARGYSSPTVAELAPSGSRINTALRAEYGMNYELGIKGTLGVAGLHYDISAFRYELSHAIVLRKDSAGGDNYVNAGGTRQSGLEAKLEYRLKAKYGSRFPSANLWTSFTVYDFKYSHFIQELKDFSGKQLPGSAAHTLAAGADVQLPARLFVSVNYYFSDRIALNDANTSYADPYHLLGIKCSYRPHIGKVASEVFAGADNILNQQYSLGNDINAAGGRYFNAAMPLNFYVGITLNWLP